ncbi:hypothetical protein [Myxococcus sp. RHSTA-1-4]|uniref:hypothetical protein n=1 Tax=Myxococcus sp. RHSTA-1-4 TaxID=2874601 RepID=UPI001CC05452|nr:hypothetical protein [Myxococcus sp. RHSTA-1-4]MBZ4421587.1 hypothetical protein [Myxococcus sp. RHSTA-1-4]
MLRLLCVVALSAIGLTACGGSDIEAGDTLESTRQGLACEIETGYCPGDTVCAWFSTNTGEGLCREPCINGTCPQTNQICCTQPNGAPYCNWRCL